MAWGTFKRGTTEFESIVGPGRQIDTDPKPTVGPEAEEGPSKTERLGQLLSSVTPGPNYRGSNGTTNRDRQVMTWRLPNGSSVQMYMNPENFTVRDSKQITPTRTKGGFVVQYWGDNLTQLTLSGTTGSSGVQGIQVLRDIYRSENKAFELVAATQTRDLITAFENGGFDLDKAEESLNTIAEKLADRNFILRPSLASLSLGVMLFYQGIQYRGFFTEFSMTESVSKLGLFDYSMAFSVTETRGSRKNFMAWHKDPLFDSLSGQFINGVGNAIRSGFGLDSQAPQQFHPENAPLSFGGNAVKSAAGVTGSDTPEGYLI